MPKVWITGTSAGLGEALCKEYLHHGWHVEGIGRNHTISHERYRAVNLDLASITGREEDIFLGCDHNTESLLILNAGVVTPIKHCGSFKSEVALNSIAVNYASVVHLCNQYVKQIKQIPHHTAGIIYISSGAARKPYDGWSVYCSSKAASEMYIRCIAEDLKVENIKHIKVYSIAPGVIETAMQHTIRMTDAADLSRVQHFKNLHKQGNLSQPEEVAKKLFEIWRQRSNYDEVCLDLRMIE